ncbi:hypothetical protein ABPG77_001025 [Micractinium sp. CCAP 211/92]
MRSVTLSSRLFADHNLHCEDLLGSRTSLSTLRAGRLQSIRVRVDVRTYAKGDQGNNADTDSYRAGRDGAAPREDPPEGDRPSGANGQGKDSRAEPGAALFDFRLYQPIWVLAVRDTLQHTEWRKLIPELERWCPLPENTDLTGLSKDGKSKKYVLAKDKYIRLTFYPGTGTLILNARDRISEASFQHYFRAALCFMHIRDEGMAA